MINALKSGDKALCESLMDEHIDMTIKAVIKANKEKADEK